MNFFFNVASATALVLATLAPTLGDAGAVRASRGQVVFLADWSGPSPGGRDTARVAETESNNPSPGSRDTARA